MTSVFIDSNVLLDVMTDDDRWYPWSAAAVERATDTSRLVINAVVYAEGSVRWSRAEGLDAALPKHVFERETIPYEAASLAGKCLSLYRRRGGSRSSPCRISS